jgi:hypothetical protein
VAFVELVPVIEAKPRRPEVGFAAAMQELTRGVAFKPAAWTRERAAQMTALFDSLATAWPDRDRPERHDALRDALMRGGPFPGGPCLG